MEAFIDKRTTEATRLAKSMPGESVTFRRPEAGDGAAITKLIAECPPLDRNSAYCNLLQSTHFAETCLVAERSEQLLGWVSGYRLPSQPDRLFVWQVAVHMSARGTGVGGAMLERLFSTLEAAGVTHMLTTITQDNAPSWSMFRRFARRRGFAITTEPLFDRDTHFGGEHETEWLVTMGPGPPASHQSRHYREE